MPSLSHLVGRVCRLSYAPSRSATRRHAEARGGSSSAVHPGQPSTGLCGLGNRGSPLPPPRRCPGWAGVEIIPLRPGRAAPGAHPDRQHLQGLHRHDRPPALGRAPDRSERARPARRHDRRPRPRATVRRRAAPIRPDGSIRRTRVALARGHGSPSRADTVALPGGHEGRRGGKQGWVSRLPSASDVPARHQHDEDGNHEGPHGRCAVVRAVGDQSEHVQADTPRAWLHLPRVPVPGLHALWAVAGILTAAADALGSTTLGTAWIVMQGPIVAPREPSSTWACAASDIRKVGAAGVGGSRQASAGPGRRR